MDDKINIINYGTKYMHDFPDPDDIREKLKDGGMAFIKDKATMHEYVLMNPLHCWTRIDTTIVTKHMEKVYEVEFIQYTNYTKDTVSYENETGKINYLHVGEEPFLIRESEFDRYMKFGKGFRVVRFVGNIEVYK